MLLKSANNNPFCTLPRFLEELVEIRVFQNSLNQLLLPFKSGALQGPCLQRNPADPTDKTMAEDDDAPTLPVCAVLLDKPLDILLASFAYAALEQLRHLALLHGFTLRCWWAPGPRF